MNDAVTLQGNRAVGVQGHCIGGTRKLMAVGAVFLQQGLGIGGGATVYIEAKYDRLGMNAIIFLADGEHQVVRVTVLAVVIGGVILFKSGIGGEHQRIGMRLAPARPTAEPQSGHQVIAMGSPAIVSFTISW